METPVFSSAYKHPPDGFYMIEPAGEHMNREAGMIQVIDAKAMERISGAFNAAADEGTLSHGSEMLVDHEHFRHQADKESIAYGWLQELQARADGIYGKIRWTNTGKSAVDGGDYRFFSTEYDFQDIENLGGNPQRGRPMRLDGLTLTNMNNNRGQKPITNRAPASESSETEPYDPTPFNEENPAMSLRLIAEKKAKQFGIRFVEAFEIVSKLHPDLSAKANGAPPLKNREMAVWDQVGALAKHIQLSTKCDFTTAFNRAQTIKNRAFRHVTPGRILNRGNSPDLMTMTVEQINQAMASWSDLDRAKARRHLVTREEYRKKCYGVQRDYGLSWTDAWEQTGFEYPHLAEALERNFEDWPDDILRPDILRK